jgi:predicted ferric reductase
MPTASPAATRRASQLLLLRRIGLFSMYAVLAVVPLALALVGPHPPGRGFWLDASFGFGLVGLGMLGLQFLSVARINRVDAPYGIDSVMRYHRQIAFVAVAFIVIHPTLLLARAWSTYWPIVNPLHAPTRVQWGQGAFLMLVFLVVVSVLRLRWRLEYELWRITHGILAVLITGFALMHVRSVGIYVTTGTWKPAAFTAFALLFMALLAWVRVLKPLARLFRAYVVEETRPEPGGAVTIRLRPVRQGVGLRFRAGQFSWITLASTPFAQDEHPFSISSSAARPERVEFTIKELGDFTRRVQEIPPGTRAYLDGPFGNFGVGWDAASDLLLVAGGIGVTPCMSIIRTMADTADPRPVTLVYGNNDWDSVVFRDELAELEGMLNLTVVHVLARGHEGWEGDVGFINTEILRRVLPADMSGLQAYVCGPPPMMAAVERGLLEAGVPPRQVHSELFTFV